MTTQRKCKVILLPTEKASHIYVNRVSKALEYKDKATIYTHPGQGQHLYILSDEEIKEGDWFIDIRESYSKIVYQCTAVTSNFLFSTLKEVNHPIAYCKKIIATTDESLSIKHMVIDTLGSGFENISLPQPSQQFIEIFVSEYNKGNIITEVMVEYEIITKRYGSCSIGEGVTMNVGKLKINSDNTINIKPIKDSWSREEVRSLFHKFNKNVKGIFNGEYIDKWIEQNL